MSTMIATILFWSLLAIIAAGVFFDILTHWMRGKWRLFFLGLAGLWWVVATYVTKDAGIPYIISIVIGVSLLIWTESLYEKLRGVTINRSRKVWTRAAAFGISGCATLACVA